LTENLLEFQENYLLCEILKHFFPIEKMESSQAIGEFSAVVIPDYSIVWFQLNYLVWYLFVGLLKKTKKKSLKTKKPTKQK